MGSKRLYSSDDGAGIPGREGDGVKAGNLTSRLILSRGRIERRRAIVVGKRWRAKKDA